MTSKKIAEAARLAYQSLKIKSFFWDSEVPGYAHAKMFEPRKILTAIRCANVVERDGCQLLHDGEGRLVPRLGKRPDGLYNIYDDHKAERLIAKAAKGDQVAHNLLSRVAARFIEGGCALPP